MAGGERVQRARGCCAERSDVIVKRWMEEYGLFLAGVIVGLALLLLYGQAVGSGSPGGQMMRETERFGGGYFRFVGSGADEASGARGIGAASRSGLQGADEASGSRGIGAASRSGLQGADEASGSRGIGAASRSGLQGADEASEARGIGAREGGYGVGAACAGEMSGADGAAAGVSA